jgi:hypothetical protein
MSLDEHFDSHHFPEHPRKHIDFREHSVLKCNQTNHP